MSMLNRFDRDGFRWWWRWFVYRRKTNDIDRTVVVLIDSLFVSPRLLEQFCAAADDRPRRFSFFTNTSTSKNSDCIEGHQEHDAYFERVVVRRCLVRAFVVSLALWSVHFSDQLEKDLVAQLDDENGSYRFHSPIASREGVHFPRWVRSCFWCERNSTLLQLVAGPMSMPTTTMRLMMSKWMALVHWSAKMYQSPCLKDRSALLIDLIDNNGEGYHKVMNECQSTDLPRCFWEFSLFRLFPLLLLLLALLSIASMVNGRDSSVEEKDAYLISLVVLSSFVSVYLDESRQKV